MDNSVFVFADGSQIHGRDISALLGKSLTPGDVGIEIEVEGNKFKKEDIPHPWAYKHDGSLRGKDNAEYILRRPIKFEEVPAAIGTLWQMFSDYGSVLDDSNRTSVHVHLNVQRFHKNRLCSFAALYFCVEEILTEWCGEHRVGNLFCLRAKDAPAIVYHLKKFLLEGPAWNLSENLHYAAFNIHALVKFGSIEIRTLRGVKDPGIIMAWVSILERLYKLSEEYPDPRAICESFSGEGPFEFLRKLLGDKHDLVMSGISYNGQQIMEAMYTGIRLAQDLCYCRDWTLYKPVDSRKDPFGRRRLSMPITDYVQNVEAATALWNGLPSFSPGSPGVPQLASAQSSEIYDPYQDLEDAYNEENEDEDEDEAEEEQDFY